MNGLSELEKSIEVLKRIKRIKDSFHQMMESELKGVNLTAPQGMMVGMISKQGAMRITDISLKMGLSNSTVSELVSRLEKNGVLERKRSEEDKRVVLVTLTDRFKKESKCFFDKIENTWLERIHKANPEEVDIILEGLSILERLMVGGENDKTH